MFKHILLPIDGADPSLRAADVNCASGYEFDRRAQSAIVGTATQHHCDLSVMASHGWRGVDRLLLGSEIHRVILHGSVPVLICR
jgi:nucleotide-binding universal stress UspA family protein